ncbi:methionine--tRNA ligase subunit beta [Candidatus Beckwithbacteria bacterium]|nr:methionine--tRNA ligase subunit beta [Candidatus Beckwithbacteria bacterium]
MKNLIAFPDFAKIDLRVGEVLTAEKLEKSEKLLRLQVDFGEEIGQRQILAGISQFYNPEDLIGRQVIAIVNLEPRKIMGLESQGMLLAAGEEEAVLLMPDKKIKTGTLIR